MQFRIATLTDIPWLIKLRMQFLKEIFPEEDISLEEKLISNLEKYFNSHIPTGNFISWLAISDNIIVGTGGICFNSYPPSFSSINEKRGYIMNIYVLPAYRKQGIGETIFKKLITDARQEGVNMITLHATEMGAHLYEKFGFKAKNNEMYLNL